MEDSRKDKRDGEKGILTPNPHVDGRNVKKAIVYNTKEEKNEGTQKEKTREIEEKENEKTKRVVYSQVIALEHV